MLQKFIQRRAELIEQTDPDRIYVENIRSFFKIPYRMARFFCEMAVKERFFRKKVGVFCTNDDCGRLIHSYNKRSEIDDEIICDLCADLERDKFVFEKEEIHITEFYQLTK